MHGVSKAPIYILSVVLPHRVRSQTFRATLWPAAQSPRRFRLRGIEKVNMEGLMTAAGQNIKRLIRQRGAGSPSHSGASLAALSIRLLSSLFRPASAKQPQSFALVP